MATRQVARVRDSRSAARTFEFLAEGEIFAAGSVVEEGRVGEEAARGGAVDVDAGIGDGAEQARGVDAGLFDEEDDVRQDESLETGGRCACEEPVEGQGRREGCVGEVDLREAGGPEDEGIEGHVGLEALAGDEVEPSEAFAAVAEAGEGPVGASEAVDGEGPQMRGSEREVAEDGVEVDPRHAHAEVEGDEGCADAAHEDLRLGEVDPTGPLHVARVEARETWAARNGCERLEALWISRVEISLEEVS